MALIFFNLLVNSVFSLLIGLLLVNFSIWFFRIETGRWKLSLLSLPFVKLVYDFARGVPAKSILFSGVDPFSLPPKHQLLTVGAGVDGWAPFFNTVFSVNALDGQLYHSSFGDYLSIWIHRRFGDGLPLAIVLAVGLISVLLLSVRVFRYVQFERERRADRAKTKRSDSLVIGRRRIDVYISSMYSGSPFTGGVFRPYICLPKMAIAKLESEEVDAVIAHEVGHVRYFDLLVTVVIQSLGDIFWFVPGYRSLSRKIDRLREVVADRWAVMNGTDPSFLASALVKLKDIPNSEDSHVLYSAFFREKSLLKERVARLLGSVEEQAPRFGWQNRWLRIAFAILISIVVLNSVFGGNFESDAGTETPKWIQHLLKVTCTCIEQKFYAVV